MGKSKLDKKERASGIMAITNISLEGFGIAITLVMIFFCIVEKHLPNKLSAIFIKMLIVNAAVLIADLLTWILENMSEYNIMLYMLNFLVYSLGYVITALFTYYVCYYISDKLNEKHTKRLFRLAYIIGGLCVIAILLVVVSLFNHMYFSFEDGVYQRGELYFISQLYPIIIMIIDMSVICKYHKILGKHDTWSLLSYGILPIIAMVIQIQIYGITLLYLSTTLSMLIIYIAIHAETGRRLQEQENELVQMRISIMLSQIQPHFLYNILATIRELCISDPKGAEKATIELSEFLQDNVYSLSAAKTIPFEQELHHTKNYLALEKIRFGERLHIIYDIKTTAFQVPTLTLQPIVENAVRYGVMKREKGGTVTITVQEQQEYFVVTVSDNGVGFNLLMLKQDDRLHIGIQNVEQRLEQMCGGKLSISSKSDIGTVVVMQIPKER